MPRRDWWNMACWNALSEAQQHRLINHGNLPFGYEPEGDGCDRGATVAIECKGDKAPGPRFYCGPCAIVLLVEKNLDEPLKGDSDG